MPIVWPGSGPALAVVVSSPSARAASTIFDFMVAKLSVGGLVTHAGFGSTKRGRRFFCRFTARAGLVTLRQRFVRRCQKGLRELYRERAIARARAAERDPALPLN